MHATATAVRGLTDMTAGGPPPPPKLSASRGPRAVRSSTSQGITVDGGWGGDREETATEPAPRQLVFAPLAWMKLMFFLHGGDTEVGGFGVTAADDPLYVEDFRTVRQAVTFASVEFDDAAVADHFDACVDAGLRPERFARVWLHTHPGQSPLPSVTDERTFDRVFGSCDWAVMFIVGRTGRTYTRLRFSAGPGGTEELDVAVDWAAWPHLALEEEASFGRHLTGWADEYAQNVWPVEPVLRLAGRGEGNAPATAAAWVDGAAKGMAAFDDDDDARDLYGPDFYDPTVDWWLDREAARLFEQGALAAMAGEEVPV